METAWIRWIAHSPLQDEKSLQKLAQDFRRIGHKWGVLRYLSEVPVFIDSQASRLVQLADLVAYFVFRKWEKKESRFFDVIEHRLDLPAELCTDYSTWTVRLATGVIPAMVHSRSLRVGAARENSIFATCRRRARARILHRMQRGALYLAVYDVSADRERARVASLLEGCGVRIQKSAFEVRLTRACRARLMAAVEALELRTGWLALYRLSDSAHRQTAGVLPEAPLDEARHAYVL